LNTAIPAHLPAVLFGTLAALVLGWLDLPVETIGSRFQYTDAAGAVTGGIPDMLPRFIWPWQQAGADGGALIWSSQMVKDLLAAAFAMAMLGAIESLLCAVVLDGMTGRRHSANSELLGQGIGNLIAPFFGGITATAAIARSAANVKAGAQSPVAAMIHALVVLLALLLLSKWLAFLPLAAMAALLLMVAWNMSDAGKSLHLINTAPLSDIWVFTLCFSFTVLFDMVVAITCGIIFAALLFVKEVAAMTKVSDVTENPKLVPEKLAGGIKVFRINGPLFFAAADRVFAELSLLSHQQHTVVLVMDGVSLLDGGGLVALDKFISTCDEAECQIFMVDLQFQPLKTLARAKIRPVDGLLTFAPTLTEVLERLPKKAMSWHVVQ
jgi:SulP family sulfate permease